MQMRCRPFIPLLRILGFLFVLTITYALVRLEYFSWNAQQFKNISLSDIFSAFMWGERFDLALIVSLATPAFLVCALPWPFCQEQTQSKVVAGLLLLFEFPLLVLSMVDVELINFTGRRMTVDSMYLMSELAGKLGSFLYTYWFLILINIFITLILLYGFKKVIEWRVSPSFSARWATWLSHVSFGFLILVVLLILQRGGLQPKPIGFAHSTVFKSSILNNLTLNSGFTFYHSIYLPKLKREKYFSSREEYQSLLNANVPGASVLEGQRLTKPQNIVIIIMESFALEFMGKVNGQKGYTPFLDSLAEKGLFFTHNFSNGRRSIEAIPSVFGGIPALMEEPFISSPYLNVDLRALPLILSEHGYETAFFHGGNNGTMLFDQFTPRAGFKYYIGASEYPYKGDHDGVWGILDEPFFQYAIERMNQFKKPFMAGIFSLSSHHPYPVPEKYKGKFPSGSLEILESIGYSDYALQRFFEEAAKQDWYQDTLFVITADHTQKVLLPQYDNELSRYRVPLIFFHPNMVWPKLDTTEITQHIDIVPSVLDFLGLPAEGTFALARSVFRPGERIAIAFNGYQYYMVSQKASMIHLPQSEFLMYSWPEDFAQTQPKVEPPEVYKYLTSRLEAAMQYFSDSLLDNRF